MLWALFTFINVWHVGRARLRENVHFCLTLTISSFVLLLSWCYFTTLYFIINIIIISWINVIILCIIIIYHYYLLVWSVYLQFSFFCCCYYFIVIVFFTLIDVIIISNIMISYPIYQKLFSFISIIVYWFKL